MSNRNFLIKPASSLCDMRCRYCFYRDEAANRKEESLGVLSPETADILIGQAFDGLSRRDSVTFAFQGGEPTLAGKDFFRHFTREVRRRNTACAGVHYAIQTNGLHIDEEWVSFLRENRFLVGLSVDGDKLLHDSLRLDAAGKGTWGRVVSCLNRLLAGGVEVNLLCVVTKPCARSAQRVYGALKKLGVRYLQFIACLDPMELPRGNMPWSLTPEDYGNFLCRLFDAWYLDWKSGHYVSIRLFDDYVHMLMGLPPGTCATGGSCGGYLVVEGDGSVYPCDFYATDEWRLGNIRDMTLPQLQSAENSRRFLARGQQKPMECGACPWRRLCSGGCQRDWVEESGTFRNYYCPSFRKLFGYAGARMAQIARAESMRRL